MIRNLVHLSPVRLCLCTIWVVSDGGPEGRVAALPLRHHHICRLHHRHVGALCGGHAREQRSIQLTQLLIDALNVCFALIGLLGVPVGEEVSCARLGVRTKSGTASETLDRMHCVDINLKRSASLLKCVI